MNLNLVPLQEKTFDELKQTNFHYGCMFKKKKRTTTIFVFSILYTNIYNFFINKLIENNSTVAK